MSNTTLAANREPRLRAAESVPSILMIFASLVRNIKFKKSILAVCLTLFAPSAFGGVVWVNWTTGATQPFANSSGAIGTVSYADTFSTFPAAPLSVSSPDVGFPFPNPLNVLLGGGGPASNGSIIFTFAGVSPDAQTVFTLGNLRPTNRFLITAFDINGAPISLTSWTDYGEYRLFPRDTGPDLWDPSTGVMVGNGNVSAQENGMNLFLGLTSGIAQIRVDFDDVDNSFDLIDWGIADSAIPEPSTIAVMALSLAGIGLRLSRRSKAT